MRAALRALKPARVDRRVAPYVLISPFLIIYAVFGLFPVCFTAWVSLHRWQLIDGEQAFVGLDNFGRMFEDPKFYNALLNTVSIFLLSTVPQLLLALGLAALLNQALRASTFWRAIVLLPNVVSVAAVGLIFGQLFSRDYGVVNFLLGRIGLPPVNWQRERWSSHLAISVMVTWRWVGYNSLLYLAAMQSVPSELYESAALDGASRWRAFWSVTVPGIRPTIAFTVVASSIMGMQLIAEPQLFDASGTGGTGGSGRQFQTVSMYLYERGFGLFDAGYAAAITWVLFLLCALVSVLSISLLRRIVARG